MPGVGSRFRDQVHLAAHHAAVLGRQYAAHKLHLLDGIDAHHVDVIPRAILRDAALLGIRVGIRSIHANAGAARAESVDPRAAAGSHIDSRREPQDSAHIPPAQRQFRNLLRIERLRLFRRSRAHQRSGSLYADRFRHGAYFQREVLAHHLSGSERNVLTLISLEALGLDPQRVGPNAEKIETEFARCVAAARECCARVVMHERHRRGRNRRPGRVRYYAIKTGRGHLRFRDLENQ